MGGVVQHAAPLGAARSRSPGGVRGAVLPCQINSGKSAGTQVTESPENPVRFSSRCGTLHITLACTHNELPRERSTTRCSPPKSPLLLPSWIQPTLPWGHHGCPCIPASRTSKRTEPDIRQLDGLPQITERRAPKASN